MSHACFALIKAKNESIKLFSTNIRNQSYITKRYDLTMSIITSASTTFDILGLGRMSSNLCGHGL